MRCRGGQGERQGQARKQGVMGSDLPVVGRSSRQGRSENGEVFSQKKKRKRKMERPDGGARGGGSSSWRCVSGHLMGWSTGQRSCRDVVELRRRGRRQGCVLHRSYW